VTPLLYQRIHLSTGDQAASLLETVKLVPQHRNLVQTLFISVPPQKVGKDYEMYQPHRTLRRLLQKHLPALKQLHLLTSSFVSSMIYIKDSLRGNISLTHLSIHSHGPCVAMSTSFVWSILREFPYLEEFWFNFQGLDGIKSETQRELPYRLKLPNIRKLGISGAVIDDDIVEWLSCISPKLEELEIDRENKFCVI